MSAAAPLVLGLETSCDETSAAVLRGRELLGHAILSQDEHRIYGGVVPEIAARAHLRVVTDVVDAALREAGVDLDRIDAYGVTAGPGLIGALLVGVTWAKTVAFALGKPLVPVHHMEAHLFAVELENEALEPPFIALLVSGGHTMLIHAVAWGRYRLLGRTRDDAAGEAFDKVAKLLGLGFPGGPAIERAAGRGDPTAHDLPRPMLSSTQRPDHADFFDFSFSGLKTAVRNRVRELEAAGTLDTGVADLAASFQAAVVETLVAKMRRAVEVTDCQTVVLAGGVAASRALRAALKEGLAPGGRLFAPSPRLATDNGAMVARAAHFHLLRGERASPDLAAVANLPFPGLEPA